MSNKTILATCYAVNPFKGSEDGMGWNFVYQIARFNKVIAITRENNREAIEKFMVQNPDNVYNNITYLYFDLPYWMRFWKKEVVALCFITHFGKEELYRLLKTKLKI